MIIAVDAAGGDYAPHEIVKGAIKAAHEYDIEIALVGRKDILHVLTSHHEKKGINIVDAPQVIEFKEHPVEAITKKPQSSIVIGTNLVKTGAASAFISAGNTGAVFVAALAMLGKIEGIERPSIGSIINLNATTPVLLIDSGANADCRPSHLVEFARVGTIYAREIFGIESPRVGLLNNGQEETKGNHLTQETHPLLKQANLNFIGNIEGQDIAKDVVDVLVTDGFTGNIVLKTLEGLGETFLKLRHLGITISRATHLQGRDLARDAKLGSTIKGMDYREVGGACLLGVNGTIIIAHGRSRAIAIKNAIGLAKRTAERGVCEKIKEENHKQANSH